MGYYGDIAVGDVVDHSARRENAISAALNAFGKTGSGKLIGRGNDYTRIPVCNFGSTDLTVGTPVILTGKTDESGTVFDVEKAVNAEKTYGILLDELPKNGASSALLFGAAIIEINIKNKNHEYAVPVAGAMESAESGVCRILWKSGDSGKKNCVILLGSGGAGGGYTGMFKIVQTEAGDDKKKPKIKVIDGSNPAAGTCGVVLINNKRFNISAKEFEVTSAGFIVLTSEYDSSGKTPKAPEMKFEKSMPAHDESKALILIGRIGLSGKSLIITQEQHGMPVGFIWGNCEDDK